MIRLPTLSLLRNSLPRADPSGQVCVLISTLPSGSPGRMPGGRSQAMACLAEVGGTPGTLLPSRGRAMTLAFRMMPGTVICLGVNGSVVWSAHGPDRLGVGGVGVGLAVATGRAAGAGSGCCSV